MPTGVTYPSNHNIFRLGYTADYTGKETRGPWRSWWWPVVFHQTEIGWSSSNGS